MWNRFRDNRIFMESKRNIQLAAEKTKPATEIQPIQRTSTATVPLEKITLLRTAPDIQKWRSALRIAESNTRPDRRLLYEVYNELMLDSHLISVTQRIEMRCTNNPIRFVDKNGKVIEGPVNDLCKMPHFFDLVKYILQSVWWGHSLVQLNFLESKYDIFQRPGVELIWRPNVRPEYGDVLLKSGDEANAVKYRMPPYNNFLLEIGKSDNLGLLNVVASNVLYKRYGVKDWAEFLEVYGMPIKEIAYDPNIPGQRAEAQKMLNEQGANAGVIIPIGSTFQLHDSAKAGNSEAFNTNATYHNKEISKTFLLQTMTTEEGSSRSQSEIHQEAENEAIKSYRLLVEMTLDYYLKPILQRHGWQIPEDANFRYDERENLSKVGMADLLVKLQSIADIPMSYIYETFEIPAPTSADDVKDNPAARSVQPDLTPPAEKKNSALSLPQYPQQRVIQLAFEDGIVTATEMELLRQVWEQKLTTGKINYTHFNALSNQLTNAVDEGYPVSTDFNSEDHLFKSLLEHNVQRFSAAKSLAMTQQLNDLKNQAKDFNEFRSLAEPLLGDYNVNWMRAEYNHAVAMAQSGAKWLQQQADKDIFPYWQYETVGDDRVRLQHQSLDGKVFRIDDPDGARLYPPNDWGCRCTARALSELPPGVQVSSLQSAIDSMGQSYWTQMQRKGFDFNPGETLQIFKQSQEYIQSFNPNALDYRLYNRQGFAQLGNKPSFTAKTMNTIEAINWFTSRIGQNNLNDQNRIRLTDYRNRPIELRRTIALSNLTPSEILSILQDILNNPDEVWLLEGSTYRREYLKFFQDKAAVITVNFNRELAEQIINLAILDGSVSIDALRRGLLIKIK